MANAEKTTDAAGSPPVILGNQSTELGSQAKDASAEEGLAPPPADSNISVQILQQLLEMGFSEGASARALLATRGDSAVESAVAWLELHAADEGLDLPLTEQEAEALRESAESRPSLSEEEAQRKAYELQRKVRMEREQREKEEALERERRRIEQTKVLLQQKALLEEEQRKRAIEQVTREREEKKKERQRQRELMRREYKERFGVDMPDDEAEGDASTRVEKMNPKEKVAFYCGALAKKYRAEEPERLAVCLKTLKQYLSNAKEHPLDSKYLRIR